jgi:outer membrane receptor protein involved in Fe transport
MTTRPCALPFAARKLFYTITLVAIPLTIWPSVDGRAQEAPAPSTPAEEIVVTGSRIRRQDFTANSPITTISADTFEQTSTIGVETVLNQLPQFVPAVTQFTTTDVQNTATNTVGASTISLRGLGPNRNLVLIDGRRGMPVNAALVVDTNSIPSAAIERVEVISGGASAVYGADAVGGVVNFILKNDFVGATIEARYGETRQGDNEEFTVSGLFGANVDGGRGNVMVGLEHSQRGRVELTSRDWQREDLANPNIAGTASFFSNTYITTNTAGNLPSQAALNNIFTALPAGAIPRNADLYFNPTPDGTGTVFTGASNAQGAAAAGSYRFAGPLVDPDHPDATYRKFQPNRLLVENSLDRWTSIPLSRYSAFGRGRYEISDSITATAQANFSRVSTETLLGIPAAGLAQNNAVVPHGSDIYAPSLEADGVTTRAAYRPGGTYLLNCPPTGGCTQSQAFPLPAEIQTLLASRTTPNDDIRVNRLLDFMGQRGSSDDTTTYQIVFGLEGDVFGDSHWDVSYSTGNTHDVVNFTGMTSRERWREVVAAPNFGVGFLRQGNALGGGFAGGLATCTTGLPIARDFVPSDDCIAALRANLQNNSELDQTILEANLTGDLASMPAGPLQYSIGATQREEKYAFRTDSYTTNESFTATGIGLFPTTNTSGAFDVTEIYGELLIPLASDVKGVEHFNLELGGRASDYSTVGKVDTYKALIDWGFTSWARLRGGVNRANRAPNLGELFLSRTQVVGNPGGVYGDQCSENSLEGPYSANPAVNVNGASGAAFAKAICSAIMTSTGASIYYGRPIVDQPQLGANGLPNTTGNRDLQSEEADTFTVGLVVGPVSDLPFLRAMTVSLDYYEIEIMDMIAVEDADAVYQRCLDPVFNPSGDPTTRACMGLLRDPQTGNPVSIDLSYTNEGRSVTSGFDLQLNWSAMLQSGGLNLNVLANYNTESTTQVAEGLAAIDWAGTQGCALQLQCMGYDYRVFSTLSYLRGKWSASFRWQHWPSIKSAAYATNPNTVQPGVSGSYDLFALSARYDLNQRFSIRMGIENLFDKEPPLSGGNPAGTPFPTAPTHAGGATYDPLGQRLFASLTMDF